VTLKNLSTHHLSIPENWQIASTVSLASQENSKESRKEESAFYVKQHSERNFGEKGQQLPYQALL
jgi:hypothetical protein